MPTAAYKSLTRRKAEAVQAHIELLTEIEDRTGIVQDDLPMWEQMFDEFFCEEARAIIRQRVAIDQRTGCWCWVGAATPKGYGTVGLFGSYYIAARLSFKAFKGDPGALFVCHSCDNPPCVNPDHLWLGTHQENMEDMVVKGRQGKRRCGDDHHFRRNPELAARGVRNGAHAHPDKVRRGKEHKGAKLSEEHVAAILASSERQTTLAARYGVNQSTISAIQRGHRWKHFRERADADRRAGDLFGRVSAEEARVS